MFGVDARDAYAAGAGAIATGEGAVAVAGVGGARTEFVGWGSGEEWARTPKET